MGTEIQSERNLSGCSPIWGMHRSAKNDMWSLYQEDRAKKNGQCFEPILPREMKNLEKACLEYDKEKVKQTILIHESIFKHQLQELHRLYGRQRELMNIFARKEVEPGQTEEGAPSFRPYSSHIALENNKCERNVSQVPPVQLVYGQSSQSAISCTQPFLGFSKETNMVVPFPSKGIVSSRTVIDLEIPADAGIKMPSCNGLNDVHNGDVSRSFLPMKRGFELADLNEPITIDETTDSGSADDRCHSKREDKSATPNSVLKRNSSNESSFKSFQSMNGMDKNERSSCDFNSKMMQPQVISRDLSAAFQSSKDENTKLNGISTSQHDLTGNRRKRKLFGVEIFEVSDVKSGIDSSTGSFGTSLENSLPNLNHISNSRTSDFVPDLVKSVELLDLSERNPAKVSRMAEGNPFHNVNNIYGGNKNFHHLNLDSLQNCSHQFFKSNAPLSSQKLMQKVEKASPEVHLPSPTSNKQKISQDLNISTKSSESTVSEEPVNIFDLNLSLDEEEPVIAEVELEVPKAPVSSEGDNEPSEELIRLAAEAIVAISFSAEEDIIDHELCNKSALQERSDECLQWFVEVVASHECEDTTVDLIPDEMDDYEYMTLQLEEMKSDDHFYHTYPAPFFENNQEDEETKITASSRRPRRGQARRGRQQKKDFQRDVLPGLVSLSKLQVVEDFQTFEELMKASGSTWQSGLSRRNSGKSSRGRRRRAATPPPPAHQAAAEQKPVSEEDKTLTCWGKRTRRLPRQRNGTGTSTNSTKNS